VGWIPALRRRDDLGAKRTADPEATTVNEEIGERFVRSVAARDAAALAAVLCDDIDFKALTPSKFWEATSAKDLIDDVILGRWFEDSDHIEGIDAIECDTVVDRHRVGYRFRVRNADGVFAVEQQAYFDVRDGRISWLRVLCAGFRPLESAS
jgi:hypothetical protein